MTNELEDESYVIQIRAKLNQQKVKLWELPYYNAATEECSIPEMEVILSYSGLLNICLIRVFAEISNRIS